MFDVYYLGRNDKVKELVPFAKEIDSENDIKPRTKMYWLIEPNVEILDMDILKYRPPEYDQIFEHVWKWDAKNYGGIKLVPTANCQGTKQLNHIVCKKSFDILSTPTPGNYFKSNPYATHVWCVDDEYVLTDDINWAPDMFEPDFIHSFHLRGQLEDKYPSEEGGIKLYPRNWKKCGVKYHGFLDNVIKYPIMYVDDPEDYSQRDTLADEYVWLIDREHRINEDSLDWAPGPFEQGFIHSFRMPNQLQNKNWSNKHHEPNRLLGGIRLVPKDWKGAYDKIQNGIIIHKDCPIEDENYDVFFTNKDFSPETFEHYAKRSLTEWFWVVDWDYDFNGKLLFIPAEHEQEYIHVFKWGLEYRYDPAVTDLWDKRVSGIYLVNKNFDYSKQKLHTNVCPVKYDIFYTDDVNNFLIPSRKSRTDMFWLVDQDHILSNNFTYVPSEHDQKYIHIFKIAGQLEHKYDPDITNISDNRAGGVKLVPKNFADAEKKFILKDPLASVSHRSYYVSDPSEYTLAPEGVSCWLIDKEYDIDTELMWQPPKTQTNCVHIFHMPSKISDASKYKTGETGGVVWLPALNHLERANAEVIVHSESPITQSSGAGFDVFSSLEDGFKHSTTDWFWVIDKHVEVLDTFSFNFVPSEFDKNKVHVWQKLNPITERQYDYDGVKLVPLGIDSEDIKKRPKFIRETACKQKEFPVYKVDPTVNLMKQLVEFDSKTSNSAFWVIDPHVEIAPDFLFDYYPTQWDAENVHVFQDQDGNYRNVRLYPSGFFEKYTELTDEDISNNSFEHVKLMNSVASMRVNWPIIYMSEVDTEQFVDKLDEFHKMGYAYAWSVDSDVTLNNKIMESGFQPKVTDVDKIHLWQINNPHNNTVQGYGGLRLWPTGRDYSTLTTSKLKLNKLKGLHYIREVGSTYKPFDIVFISYKDEYADQKFRNLKKTYPKAKWIRDVDGIFEAHKKAAEKCRSKMMWVIDSDAELVDDFDFNYIPDVYDQETTHVWKTINPVTGSEYGYGGVKLLNRERILSLTNWGLDFTTGISPDFKLIEQVSNVTRFNTDPLSTWRSAFREAAKLTLKDDEESKQRLDAWLSPEPSALFSEYAKAGAEAGNAYAEKYGNKPLRMSRINDFGWLENQFSSYESSK